VFIFFRTSNFRVLTAFFVSPCPNLFSWQQNAIQDDRKLLLYFWGAPSGYTFNLDVSAVWCISCGYVFVCLFVCFRIRSRNKGRGLMPAGVGPSLGLRHFLWYLPAGRVAS
jgi:hypothetical protein